MDGARKGKDGVLEAIGAQAWMMPGVNLWVIVDYPGLRMDDIVPVFGQLGRVSEIQDRGEPKGYPKGKDSMLLTKVEEKSLPPGLNFATGSIVVPLVRDRVGGTGFDGGYTRVRVMEIQPAASEDERGPVAEIQFYDNDKSPSMTVMKLRRGDTLAIRKAQYKVLNVVPRDEKTHVIGWVELAP